MWSTKSSACTVVYYVVKMQNSNYSISCFYSERMSIYVLSVSKASSLPVANYTHKCAFSPWRRKAMKHTLKMPVLIQHFREYCGTKYTREYVMQLSKC